MTIHRLSSQQGSVAPLYTKLSLGRNSGSPKWLLHKPRIPGPARWRHSLDGSGRPIVPEPGNKNIHSESSLESFFLSGGGGPHPAEAAARLPSAVCCSGASLLLQERPSHDTLSRRIGALLNTSRCYIPCSVVPLPLSNSFAPLHSCRRVWFARAK